MIDVYFMLKEKGDAVGGISLKELHPTMKINIWETYKVYPITEKTVLFKKNDNEFCTINGKYKHEMGEIKVKIIDDNIGTKWLNVNIKEK